MCSRRRIINIFEIIYGSPVRWGSAGDATAGECTQKGFAGGDGEAGVGVRVCIICSCVFVRLRMYVWWGNCKAKNK